MKIGKRTIGNGSPTYIIAELSCNHNQDLELAKQLIKEASRCGADAVKLQTYTADTITIDCDNDDFKIKGGLWDGYKLYDLYKKAYTPWEWHPILKEEANRLGMDLFSSPFDTTAVDFLETLDVPVYKIASFEAMDHTLLKKVALTKKPIIISSGVMEYNDIIESLDVLKMNGCGDICLLKCTSQYPAPIEEANLKTIEDMKDRFHVEVGLSDHTLGIEVPIASVCLGASVIEKHFTLSRQSGSLDDAFSLEPSEFKLMVESIRKIEKSFGGVKYSKPDKKGFEYRRSLYVVKDMNINEKFTEENVRSIRPGFGLHTRHYDNILGKRAMKSIKRGTPLSVDLIKNYSLE